MAEFCMPFGAGPAVMMPARCVGQMSCLCDIQTLHVVHDATFGPIRCPGSHGLSECPARMTYITSQQAVPGRMQALTAMLEEGARGSFELELGGGYSTMEFGAARLLSAPAALEMDLGSMMM